MIKNIIFDLGNVVTSFNPHSYIVNVLHDEQLSKECGKLIFEGTIWNAYDQGLYTKDELIEALVTKYPHYQEAITLILKDWVTVLQTIPTTISWMKELKKQGYQLYILSNINEEAYEYLKSEVYFSLVNGAVLSYQEKLNKPDARIYERLMNRYQLVSDECIFIDDRKENIVAANALGIHGIVYQNHEQVVAEAKAIMNGELAC